MPGTLGLLVAVLIIALLGGFVITLNDREGPDFYLDGVLQGKSESLDIHAGDGIDVIVDSSPDQTDYTVSTHLGATIGGSSITPAGGSSTAVADTIDLESPDGSLAITATHNTTAGNNVSNLTCMTLYRGNHFCRPVASAENVADIFGFYGLLKNSWVRKSPKCV